MNYGTGLESEDELISMEKMKEIRDAIKIQDGMDGDDWDFAMANAVASYIASQSPAPIPEQVAQAGSQGLKRVSVSSWSGNPVEDADGEFYLAADVERLLATQSLKQGAQPSAWMQEDRKQCTTAESKKKMENAGFGHWAKIAARYTIPLYEGSPTQASVEQATGAKEGQKHLPGWERGIATVTMNGHQLREALDFINPDGDDDEDQRDDELTFGIVQHKDDDGKVATGLCCWNDDTDGVLPLSEIPLAEIERIDRASTAGAESGGKGGSDA